MLRPSDIAARPDLRLGDVEISPSRRRVEGPLGTVHVEPRTMQVFVLLLDGAGRVVTRNELFDECWGGAMVGDDSLNRAIGKVRRIAVDTAPEFFEVETIPRTGYRLTGPILGYLNQPADPASGEAQRYSRRRLMTAALAVAGLAGGSWWMVRKRVDPRVAALIERGHQILRESDPSTERQAVDLLARAVELEPDNAHAWGLLALAYRDLVENGNPAVVTPAVQAAERAANRALDLDDKNGEALTALATLRPDFGNWNPVERQLRTALSKDPSCVAALNALTLVLQSVGRSKESFILNEKAAHLDPLDVTPQYRMAIKSWIFGRIDEADGVLDRGLQIWPNHPALWNTRLMVLAYSDRPEVGLRYLERSLRANPRLERTGLLWRVTLEALMTEDRAVRLRTRDVLRDRAARSSSAAAHSIMALSQLGLLDDAFDVANGYYRWRGKLAGAEKSAPGETLLNDQSWRRTMALFTPATRLLRRDRRFYALAEGIGMADYWRQTNTRPDSFLMV